MMGKNSILWMAWSVMLLISVWAYAAEEVIVYSARNESLIQPLFDAYTKETGVQIRYITDSEAPLLARLQLEGTRTSADLLITIDAGNLWHAAKLGVLASIASPVLMQNVPAHLRDPQNRWFGLSKRARTIVYRTDRVKPQELSTYEALGDSRWKGRLCLRTSKKVYNQSMIAMMIAALGEQGTERVLSSWIANLATDIFSDDTQVLEAIAAGQCDVGIVNTYYYGRLIAKKPKLPLSLFWPNQKDRGVHINISGAGVARYAKHPEAAKKLLEWLSAPKAQRIFAKLDFEYPVHAEIPPSATVLSWGMFRQEQMDISRAGELQSKAVKLMDRVGYK